MTLHDFVCNHYMPPWLDPKLHKGPIYIDDHNEHDVLHTFCRLSVEFPSREAFEFDLTLQNVPWDDLVEKVAAELNGNWSEISTGRCLTLRMTVKSAPQVKRLAEAIRKVTGRGRRYSDCNWKWISARASDSLKQFAGLLVEYRRPPR